MDKNLADKLRNAFDNSTINQNMSRGSRNPNFENIIDFRDPDEAVNNVLSFLQAQSNTADKQYKTSTNLIIATIVIMILQIVIAVISIYKSNEEQNNLTKLVESQSQQSETISRMSLSLLDLHNQVNILEKENEVLRKK